MPSVGIFPLGYTVINFPRLCAFLNGAQGHFEFQQGSAIANIGDPDLAVYGYSDATFLALLCPHLEDFDYSLAVTSVPIEGNFFTRTVERRLIITTTFQSEELLRRAGRTQEENLSLTLCQELMSFEFQRVTGLTWRDLFHRDPRGCIFDSVPIKSQKIAKLTTCDICEPCRGKLAGSNMNANVLRSVDAILRRIRRPSLKNAILTSFLSPGFSFVYGGIVVGAAVNVVSSVLMGQERLSTPQLYVLWSLVAGVLLFPLLVYGWKWFEHFRKRFR